MGNKQFAIGGENDVQEATAKCKFDIFPSLRKVFDYMSMAIYR